MNTSNMWSAEHAILDTAEGLVLIHGGFSPNRSFIFDPTTVTWGAGQDTAEDRFYSTTLVIADGRALTLFGSASKSIEVYSHGAGWGVPYLCLYQCINMNITHGLLLPDGRLL